MVPVVNVPMIGSFLMLQNKQVKITFVKEKILPNVEIGLLKAL